MRPHVLFISLTFTGQLSSLNYFTMHRLNLGEPKENFLNKAHALLLVIASDSFLVVSGKVLFIHKVNCFSTQMRY